MTFLYTVAVRPGSGGACGCGEYGVRVRLAGRGHAYGGTCVILPRACCGQEADGFRLNLPWNTFQDARDYGWDVKDGPSTGQHLLGKMRDEV